MDDLERQRTMDFILRQQAQLAASAQRNEEEHAQFTRSLEQLTRRLKQLGSIAVLMARQYRHDRTDQRERIDALIDAQLSSEEKQSNSSDWQARMEESFARSDVRMTRVEADAERNGKDIAALLVSTERNSEAITKLVESTDRNSEAVAKLAASGDRNREDIAALARVVADMAGRRNGGKESA